MKAPAAIVAGWGTDAGWNMLPLRLRLLSCGAWLSCMMDASAAAGPDTADAAAVAAVAAAGAAAGAGSVEGVVAVGLAAGLAAW
jgi:hypothetical protein